MGKSIHEIPLHPAVLKRAKSFMYDSVADRQFDVDAPAELRTPVVWKEKLAHWLEVQARWHQTYPAASNAACNVACWMRADFMFLMNSEEARCDCQLHWCPPRHEGQPGLAATRIAETLMMQVWMSNDGDDTLPLFTCSVDLNRLDTCLVRVGNARAPLALQKLELLPKLGFLMTKDVVRSGSEFVLDTAHLALEALQQDGWRPFLLQEPSITANETEPDQLQPGYFNFADDDGADAGESETRAPDSADSSADEEDAEVENPAVDEEMLSAAGADEEDVAAQGAGMEQME